jgi:hypothetical protein
MSKIAELLKLAEQKKEDTKIELPFPALPKLKDSVSRSKQEEIGVSKSKEVGASRDKYGGVSGSKGKHEQTNISQPDRDDVDINTDNSAQNSAVSKSVETSPTRDFTKVSNSIMKRAIPEKYFRGLSKHTYDVLYQRTRGAIVPKRTIQLTKDELVRLTGISKDAIKLHIKYLKEIGLLKSRPAIGSHAGWEYEILVPEEIEETEQVEVRQDKARQGKASENLPLHSGQNLPPLTHSNLVENKDVYEFSKTSLKTDTKNDDEANAALREVAGKLDAVSKKLTGKGLSAREAEKWGSLVDLLILELEIAAKKTDSISSVPAFLTEVLRRKLRDVPTGVNKPVKAKVDTVGKPEPDSYEIKPLDEKAREAALDQLRDFAEDDFLQDFKKWYTSDDWNWLMQKLKTEDEKREKKQSEQI